MKKVLIISLLAMSLCVQAQFYVSTSGGYALPSAGSRLGQETTPTTTENFYGSYGEGIYAQVRTGYGFSNNFGVELAFGYLHGSDQTINKVSISGQPLIDIKARGRAYGASLSLVYNFSDNVYGRFGGVVKAGGRTEALGSVHGIFIPDGTIPGVPMDTTLDFDFEQHFNGKLPIGFVGALGYKHNLNTMVAVFVELEYIGISITRDKATMETFSARLRETGTTLSINQTRAILEAGGNGLASTLYREIDFVDELPLTNTDGSKQLAQKVPYSSFGFNIGITIQLGTSLTKIKDEDSYMKKNSL